MDEKKIKTALKQQFKNYGQFLKLVQEIAGNDPLAKELITVSKQHYNAVSKAVNDSKAASKADLTSLMKKELKLVFKFLKRFIPESKLKQIVAREIKKGEKLKEKLLKTDNIKENVDPFTAINRTIGTMSAATQIGIAVFNMLKMFIIVSILISAYNVIVKGHGDEIGREVFNPFKMFFPIKMAVKIKDPVIRVAAVVLGLVIASFVGQFWLSVAEAVRVGVSTATMFSQLKKVENMFSSKTYKAKKKNSN